MSKQWPKQRWGESNAHYAQRLGVCFHRMRVIHKKELDGKITILLICRWCARLARQIITFDTNCRSIYSNKVFEWLEEGIPTSPTSAPVTPHSLIVESTAY